MDSINITFYWPLKALCANLRNHCWNWEWSQGIDVLILYQILWPEPQILVLFLHWQQWSVSTGIHLFLVNVSGPPEREWGKCLLHFTVHLKKTWSAYQKPKLRQNWHCYLTTKLMCVPTLKRWSSTVILKVKIILLFSVMYYFVQVPQHDPSTGVLIQVFV